MAVPVHKEAKRAAIAKIRAVEAILRRWDPIGVEPGVVAPADEYDSYAPHIVSMVDSGGSVADVTVHLGKLATENMGLGEIPQVAHDQPFAEEIVRALRGSVPYP